MGEVIEAVGGCSVCGDVDCLCDVIRTEQSIREIGTPVPYRYGFGGDLGEKTTQRHSACVLGSDILARAKKLGVPWTDEDAIEFMAELMDCYDAYRAATDRPHAPVFTQDMDDVPNDGRREIADLLRDGHSMVDMPIMLGLTPDEVIDVLSHSNPRAFYHDWVDSDWLRFEAMIEGDGPFVVRDIYKMLGLTSNADASVGKLLLLYGKQVQSTDRRPPDAVARVVVPLVDQGVTDPDVIVVAILAAGLQPPNRSALMKRVRKAQNRQPRRKHGLSPRYAKAARVLTAIGATRVVGA